MVKPNGDPRCRRETNVKIAIKKPRTAFVGRSKPNSKLENKHTLQAKSFRTLGFCLIF